MIKNLKNRSVQAAIHQQARIHHQNHLHYLAQLRNQARIRHQEKLRYQAQLRDQTRVRRQNQLRLKAQIRNQNRISNRNQTPIQSEPPVKSKEPGQPQMPNKVRIRNQTQTRNQPRIHNPDIQTEEQVRNHYSESKKASLTNRSFSLFSNNCLAAFIYLLWDQEYRSPTQSLFMYAEDYLEFLENLPYYLTLDPTDVSDSSSQPRQKTGFRYPLGLLGDKVTLHFSHDTTFAEAREKWNRRKTRVNPDEIYVAMSTTQGCCNVNQAKRFMRLPYPKVFLTNRDINHPDSVNLDRFRQPRSKSELSLFKVDKNGKRLFEYFDWASWLNSHGELHARDILQGKTTL
ncbi:MAG: DUF1919 domain-containing protein [Oscillospiraceae bacterium]|nr:DUF1919 domain-containing protein [Oscillospiraceae bacterium]